MALSACQRRMAASSGANAARNRSAATRRVLILDMQKAAANPIAPEMIPPKMLPKKLATSVHHALRAAISRVLGGGTAWCAPWSGHAASAGRAPPRAGRPACLSATAGPYLRLSRTAVERRPQSPYSNGNPKPGVCGRESPDPPSHADSIGAGEAGGKHAVGSGRGSNNLTVAATIS